MMITHDEVLSVLGAVAAGVTYYLGWVTSERRLDKAWDQGHGVGRDEGYTAGYAIGVDDEHRGLAYAYDEDGNEREDSRPGLPPGPGPHDLASPCTVCGGHHDIDDVRALNGLSRGPEIDSAATDPSPRDWGDELSATHVSIALDDATEVLEAAPPPLPPSGTWEYRLAEWMSEQDQWLARTRTEVAEWCASKGISREGASA
jgi:hypothetical protein